MNKYNFDKFENDLNNGFQIYLTFVNNRYLIYKTSDNCYTQKLVDYDEKNPQPRQIVITNKRLEEIFTFATELEYKRMEI